MRFFPRQLTYEGRLLSAALVTFVAIALLAGLDLALDFRQGLTVAHVLAEGTVFALGAVGAILVARRLAQIVRESQALRQQTDSLASQLAFTEAEAARWRNEAADLLKGLGAALDQQFVRWGLSAAEKEVALLLLKGLSHKDIAEVRSVTEATARQQSRAVYKKAGLAGRNELSAFFLEDLLLPRS